MEVEFSKQWNLRMWIIKYERDDLHTLKTTFSISPEKYQTSNIKACEGMNHAIIRNVKCALKIIGSRNKGARGSWPLLNLKPLHRNAIFAIENHFSLAK